jgi:hypothetical protein
MNQKQIITVNGRTYQLRESVEVKKKPINSKTKRILATMMLMSGITGMYDFGYQGKTSPIKNSENSINFMIDEFSLIENKKSQLSRKHRDSVKATFHRQFYEVFVSPEYKYIIKFVRKNTDGSEKVMYYNAPMHQLNFDPEVATRYIDGDDPRYQADMKKLVNSIEGDDFNAYPVEFETELENYIIKNTEL